jgi:hypothetical protein
MQSYDPKNKETKQENESPIEQGEEQKGDIIDSTTPLTIVKNKKRVHYPQINGEQPVLNTVKTNSLQENYDKTTSGKEKKIEIILRMILFFFSRSVFQNNNRLF